VLEFSHVWKPLGPLYDAYSFNVLPALGKLIAKDAESYRYLAESIRMFPSQEELKLMMERAGFEKVDFFNLTAGLVALHVGMKF
jgi:demethylmenaquinone methyltransferase/2-methoxy-6-polyprenyl-1,4-benzoquinol methylase